MTWYGTIRHRRVLYSIVWYIIFDYFRILDSVILQKIERSNKKNRKKMEGREKKEMEKGANDMIQDIISYNIISYES